MTGIPEHQILRAELLLKKDLEFLASSQIHQHLLQAESPPLHLSLCWSPTAGSEKTPHKLSSEQDLYKNKKPQNIKELKTTHNLAQPRLCECSLTNSTYVHKSQNHSFVDSILAKTETDEKRLFTTGSFAYFRLSFYRYK